MSASRAKREKNISTKMTHTEESSSESIMSDESSFGVKCHPISESLDAIDTSTATSLTPGEAIERQAVMNIGLVGNVSHGKSALVRAISGVKTVRFQQEQERNITIKLGYANSKIYRAVEASSSLTNLHHEKKINSMQQTAVGCRDLYTARGSSHKDMFTDKKTGVKYEMCRHVSFVDCPGHDLLMGTMLNGATVFDAALFIIAANEPCPQPQTAEHLAALDLMGVKNIIIIQNKIDLVSRDEALAHHKQIQKFIAGTVAESAPIIPISAERGCNIDIVCEYIANYFPLPIRNCSSVPRFVTIRSFDVNKPGQSISNLHGGVVGGSLLRGLLRVGDEVELRPGLVFKPESPDEPIRCRPIRSRVVSLSTDGNKLHCAVPGGLIGIETLIDPSLSQKDRLVGNAVGLRGMMPDVFIEIEIRYHLLRRLLGKALTSHASKQAKVHKLTESESLRINICGTSTGGEVKHVEGNSAKIELTHPICAEVGDKIALSRKIDQRWRLIGWGEVIKGNKVDVVEQ